MRVEIADQQEVIAESSANMLGQMLAYYMQNGLETDSAMSMLVGMALAIGEQSGMTPGEAFVHLQHVVDEIREDLGGLLKAH